MDLYKDTLQHIIEIIAKSYTVITVVNLCALFFSLALKNKFKTKKISITLMVILICVCLSASIVLVPRLIDLKQSTFVTIENGKLLIDETNVLKNSGSIMFYGYADAFNNDGSSIKLLGVNFFEWPSTEPNQEYYGNIVYAKYSRQLIALE